MRGRAQAPSPGLVFFILALGAGGFSLLSSLVGPALPEIQRDIHTSTTGAAWIFTGYLLGASVATPIAGRLGDMFGKKRILVPSLGVLAGAGFLCGFATSLPLLVAGRILQGVGVAIFPLGFGIIRDEFPRERVPGAIGMLSAIFGIGGAVGIVLAGPIVDHLNYHWIFWLPSFAIALAALAAFLVVPESPVRTPGSVNWAAAALLSTWLVCVLLAVSQARSWGWGSARTLGLLGAGALLCALWVRVEARSPEPLVDMRMMRLRGVWTANVNGALLGVGMFSTLIVIPSFVEAPTSTGYGFGASVTQAGLFVAPMAAAMPLTGGLAGRLTRAGGARVPLVLGGLVTSAGFVLIALAHTEHWQIYVASVLMGAGTGFGMAGMANVVVESVPPSQTGIAIGMNTIMRSIGGSIGTQLAATIIASSVLASGLPAERGYTVVFVLCAAAAGVAFLAALAAPAPVRGVRPAVAAAAAD